MALQYSTTHRNNAMADITTDAGTTAYLLIYSGAAPANCAAAATGTLLASLPCANPIAPAPASGVLTFTAAGMTASAAATGTAGYWRLCTSSAGTTVVAQGLVGTSGSDLNFAAGVSFTASETISISSMTITAFGA